MSKKIGDIEIGGLVIKADDKKKELYLVVDIQTREVNYDNVEATYHLVKYSSLKNKSYVDESSVEKLIRWASHGIDKELISVQPTELNPPYHVERKRLYVLERCIPETQVVFVRPKSLTED